MSAAWKPGPSSRHSFGEGQPAAKRQESRVALVYEPARSCVECGSVALVLMDYGNGHWRKECGTCGSTGPFAPVEKHVDPSSIYTFSGGARRARRRLGF